jgi:predicted aspartyl protease
MSDTNITRNAHKKYVKEVSINNQKIEAFIDTGRDICVMRAEQYIRVDIPKLKEKMIRFRGVGSGDNVTLSAVMTRVTIRLMFTSSRICSETRY